MSSIASLNDKCLLKIAEYLDIGEQLCLWQATDPTSRLNIILLNCWQSQNNHFLHGKIFEDKPELLHKFLECISSTVVKLTVVDFSLDQASGFRSHSFPKARVLDYSREESDVDDMETLVTCFPLIESFKMSVKDEILSAHHVVRWERLRKLDIMEASMHWKTKCFQEVCQKLELQLLSVAWIESEEDAYVEAICKLQELEELQLELMVLSRENTRKLLTLPKLKKLRLDEFEDVTDLLDIVVEMRGQDVVSLTCNENFWLYLIPNHFQNVRKVCIINEGVVEGIWTAESFNKSLREFPCLVELYLKDTTIWGTGDEFWDMIYSCPQLQLIYLHSHEIDDGCLEFSASTMDKALCQRQNPLVIHFFKTSHEELLLSHSKIEISFKVLKDAYPNLYGGLLELEFIALKS
ncbi:uncharacterized protein LOC119548554 isoform X2 [Drosophila subpulchrella]|uniref:uncharacterized protein LOC119548554 isoform X2 n=1 Tax=Drosophila subpulchrella TaxID=1486046 RepID=UPI0018A137A6|nr:uncharacterized protein LOC119548554 isoform X2 [Drosophila subpulchrella]